ncbi:MAG: uroporphyrinogen-III C-methyltransferase [Phycisphaerae bacterium]|nr:uroporphyrinogen-III C-methyltransferase [Phycisphaerae bacterium]
MADGKVYLVGAGPGDMELITVKGLRLIGEADVVLYDHLLSMELLGLVKPGAEVVSVGKFAGKHTLPQEEISALLVRKAKEGKTVVRLKGGDCYLFGRGGEEVEACHEADVPFEVVPGVTSALAAPAYAGMPPTHRDYTSDVAIVTGHRKKGDTRPIEIPKAGTVIFLMSVGNIGNIVSSLLEQGWPAETPIACIEHGTWYDQRVVGGTLANFLEKAAKADLRTPGIFIVGKVVELRDKLDWFSKRPNVLVLGNHPERYKHLGNIVHRRIIDCVPMEDYSAVDAVCKDIERFDWIVFTSVNGAKFLFERLYAMGKDARALAGARIGAIGKTTAKRLSAYGILADVVPQNESSTGLVEAFAAHEMGGKKVLLPQAEIASKELPEGLAAAGAEVTAASVYKTVDVDPGEIDFDYIDTVLFTSGSTVRAFVKKFGSLPPNVKALALGIPTQKVAQEHGIDAEVLG